MRRSVKEKVCCAPLQTTSINHKVKSGFAVAEQSLEMLKLTVLFEHEKFPAGTTIYVDGQHVGSPWMKQVLHLGDIPFVVVPEGQVVVYELPENIGASSTFP